MPEPLFSDFQAKAQRCRPQPCQTAGCLTGLRTFLQHSPLDSGRSVTCRSVQA